MDGSVNAYVLFSVETVPNVFFRYAVISRQNQNEYKILVTGFFFLYLSCYIQVSQWCMNSKLNGSTRTTLRTYSMYFSDI